MGCFNAAWTRKSYESALGERLGEIHEIIEAARCSASHRDGNGSRRPQLGPWRRPSSQSCWGWCIHRRPFVALVLSLSALLLLPSGRSSTGVPAATDGIHRTRAFSPELLVLLQQFEDLLSLRAAMPGRLAKSNASAAVLNLIGAWYACRPANRSRRKPFVGSLYHLSDRSQRHGFARDQQEFRPVPL